MISDLDNVLYRDTDLYLVYLYRTKFTCFSHKFEFPVASDTPAPGAKAEMPKLSPHCTPENGALYLRPLKVVQGGF